MKKNSLFISLGIILIFTIIPIIFFRDIEKSSVYFYITSYLLLVFMTAFMAQYFYEKNNEEPEHKKINTQLKYNLDNKEVWLIDYENYPYIPKELKNNDNAVCYIFTNTFNRERILSQLRTFDSKTIFETIYTSRTGKNLADIELSTYVGIINALYEPLSINICSKDKGFEVMRKAMENIGYNNVIIHNYNDIEVPSAECEKVYMNIKNHTVDRNMSFGNFKKRIKKARNNITSDEINYIICYLQDNNRIEIKDVNQKEKAVILK